ncbi:NADH dehydrogenase [ubiquinone] iron-sulfur protein 8, mitochondrial isoform X2 [Pseudorca crassidens]|uniref:NADH dehydrogenase [ubiquinone] iron-sulfur protein 8, mitochondrial isoform X2 n=1 Tax=Pseudorca crassidens TaxID=82174 RepID=UPI00352DF2CD
MSRLQELGSPGSLVSRTQPGGALHHFKPLPAPLANRRKDFFDPASFGCATSQSDHTTKSPRPMAASQDVGSASRRTGPSALEGEAAIQDALPDHAHAASGPGPGRTCRASQWPEPPQKHSGSHLQTRRELPGVSPGSCASSSGPQYPSPFQPPSTPGLDGHTGTGRSWRGLPRA